MLRTTMIAKFNTSIPFRFLFFFRRSSSLSPSRHLVSSSRLFSSTSVSACEAEPLVEEVDEKVGTSGNRRDAADVLREWGCRENQITKIFMRRPSLRRMKINNLESKLKLLADLGITGSDLVKIINCRPRLLSNRINRSIDERIEYLISFFGSKEVLLKAILRNPSFLTYDIDTKMKPAVDMYEKVGVSKQDLIPLLLSRPTVIPRSTLDAEKMDYIRRTGCKESSKLFKHVVCIIAISRVETVRDKLANLEKFGFSEDEVFQLIGRSPFVLTLSVDKIQRNMTFVLGTMKQPATVVLKHPWLLFNNLEGVLKPRVLLAGKIEEMCLVPQINGPLLLRAMRMTELRFLKVFVNCHPEDVANELMEFYNRAKCIRRLADSSRKHSHPGFPF